MAEAALERKGERRIRKSEESIAKEVQEAMEKDVKQIILHGMPRDTEKSAELVQVLGIELVNKALEMRKQYLQGELR